MKRWFCLMVPDRKTLKSSVPLNRFEIISVFIAMFVGSNARELLRDTSAQCLFSLRRA